MIRINEPELGGCCDLRCGCCCNANSSHRHTNKRSDRPEMRPIYLEQMSKPIVYRDSISRRNVALNINCRSRSEISQSRKKQPQPFQLEQPKSALNCLLCICFPLLFTLICVNLGLVSIILPRVSANDLPASTTSLQTDHFQHSHQGRLANEIPQARREGGHKLVARSQRHHQGHHEPRHHSSLEDVRRPRENVHLRAHKSAERSHPPGHLIVSQTRSIAPARSQSPDRLPLEQLKTATVAPSTTTNSRPLNRFARKLQLGRAHNTVNPNGRDQISLASPPMWSRPSLITSQRQRETLDRKRRRIGGSRGRDDENIVANVDGDEYDEEEEEDEYDDEDDLEDSGGHSPVGSSASGSPFSTNAFMSFFKLKPARSRLNHLGYNVADRYMFMANDVNGMVEGKDKNTVDDDVDEDSDADGADRDEDDDTAAAAAASDDDDDDDREDFGDVDGDPIENTNNDYIGRGRHEQGRKRGADQDPSLETNTEMSGSKRAILLHANPHLPYHYYKKHSAPVVVSISDNSYVSASPLASGGDSDGSSSGSTGTSTSSVSSSSSSSGRSGRSGSSSSSSSNNNNNNNNNNSRSRSNSNDQQHSSDSTSEHPNSIRGFGLPRGAGAEDDGDGNDGRAWNLNVDSSMNDVANRHQAPTSTTATTTTDSRPFELLDASESSDGYSNLIISPNNELYPNRRRHWYHDSRLASIEMVQEEPGEIDQGGFNSALIAMVFGLGATGMLVLVVGLKMRTIRERFAYKGQRRSLVPDTDFLIHTIPTQRRDSPQRSSDRGSCIFENNHDS